MGVVVNVDAEVAIGDASVYAIRHHRVARGIAGTRWIVFQVTLTFHILGDSALETVAVAAV